MGSKLGHRLRPTVERERLYLLVLEQRKEGLSYNAIIERVRAEQGVTLRKSHVSEWVNRKHRAFDPKPCPELAYVIGVKMGDASTSTGRHNYNYMIKLRVIDKEFASEFSRCLGVILGRSPPAVKWDEKKGLWHTQVSSLLLQKLLRRDLEDLIPIIKHCQICQGAFLRGFYDSEAGFSGRSLRVSNGHKDVLILVCELLDSLGIENTGVHLSKKAGALVLIKGRFYRQNLDKMYVYVRVRSLAAFRDKVGFAITRKKVGLERAINHRRSNGSDRLEKH
jgi:intein-encoded DNA endonuclease-like protein